ncbi:MAG: ComEC/Rec2 family competence protein [Candidatus Krumholzibacteria bacterium]|nr:ComEC/Rec2 family competence protein [Candidatus Krumholzibacteria bacterium]
MTASLTPIDRDALNGSAARSARRSTEFSAPASAVRKRVIAIISDRALRENTKGLLRALLIADRKALSISDRRYWSATGTAHYLALSGLHLGLIALPVFGILVLAGARGLLRDIAALFVLCFYASVAGNPGSLLRALSMMTVIRFFRIAGIRISLAQCVVAGAFLVCILDKRSLGDTGFLLSFNAAAGVAMLGAPVCRSIKNRMSGKRGRRILLPPVIALAMSLCVQLSMLPLLVRIFGFAPLAGPVMSVIMAMPVMALLYGGFIYVIAGHMTGSIAAMPLNLLSSLATGLVSRGSVLTRTVVVITDFDIRAFIPGLALCSLALRWDANRSKVFMTGLILAALSFLPPLTEQDAGREETLRLSRFEALLFGGSGGILVLENWPAAWSAPYLVREVRRSGVRNIGSLVILDPGDFEPEGISIIAGDLGAERIFFSPWFDGPYPDVAVWRSIREDTILAGESIRLPVRAPSVLPGRGKRADKGEASLVISPLD